jgi:Terminase large subunit, T4likevirus-type, N-terminal
MLKTSRDSRPGPGFFRLVGYEPFDTQLLIHKSKALRRVACLGRQVGKSELAAVDASFELITKPNITGWVVAPVSSQCEIIFERVVQKCQRAIEGIFGVHDGLPNLKLEVKRGNKLVIKISHYDRPWSGDRSAKLLGISYFKAKSAQEPDNLRGETLTFLIIDEAASVGDEQVWSKALEPMLSTTQGWVLFISTPMGFNWFYDKWKLGQPGPDKDEFWESFQSASWDANPTVPTSFYEKKKLEIPDLDFRQEYGAEFVSNSGSVFQAVDRCPKIELLGDHSTSFEQFSDYPPNPNIPDSRRFVIGADFARLQDKTVFQVVDLDTRKHVAQYVLESVAWETQLSKLQEVSKLWNNALVVGDNNGVGDYLEGEAHKLGIPFEGLKFTGTEVKTQTINHLAIGLEQGYLTILNEPALLQELRMFRYTKLPSGQLKMGAEGRNHDDRVVALSLAYSKVSHDGLLPQVNTEDARLLHALEAALNENEPIQIMTLSAFGRAEPGLTRDHQNMQVLVETLNDDVFGGSDFTDINTGLLDW